MSQHESLEIMTEVQSAKLRRFKRWTTVVLFIDVIFTLAAWIFLALITDL
jgi:hypothetical protein